MQLNYEPLRDKADYSEFWAGRIMQYISWKALNVKDILDLGMGQGHLVKMLRESGRNAIGIDVRNMGQEGLILADARNLPFEDESFDLVTEVYLLADMGDFQHLPIAEKEKVAQEAKRVLRPGGFFLTLPLSNIARPFFDKVFYKDEIWGVYQK